MMAKDYTLSIPQGLLATVNQRGATVTSFSIKGREVLFPERAIKEKFRGGIPILFPNAGAFTREMSGCHLPQHGFARDSFWDVISQESNQIVLSLESNAETISQYPYDFRLLATVTLTEYGLTCCLRVENRSERLMPVAPGFHPYFPLDKEKRTQFVANLPAGYGELSSWERTLSFPIQSPVHMQFPDGASTILESSPGFRRLMLWADPSQDFVCLEPWAGEVDAITEAPILIEPGTSREFIINLRNHD